MKKNKSNQKELPKKKSSMLRDYERPVKPVLRFSPTAWAKLISFRDLGPTEISGFGITDPYDLLYVTEFQTIKQDATVASISLDDEAVADFFESQVDTGHKPEQFFRIWCHTHPGDSPNPSGTDEETFQRVFGRCDWAIMFILAENGKTYSRLRFNVGPSGQILIPVHVDYTQPFDQSNQDAWEAEYKANIKTALWSRSLVRDDELLADAEESDLSDYSLPQDILEQLEEMEPEERRVILDELAVRPDLWEDVDEVLV